MGMSTHVVGFKPADEKWKAMKAIWDACVAAKVAPPAEVDRFFGGVMPDPAGVEVDQRALTGLREWRNDYAEGYEVDVKQLPPDVTVIRFYNSW